MLVRRKNTVPVIMFLLSIAVGLAPRWSAADEFEDFASAKNAYDAGEHEAAVVRFEALLDSDPKNKGLIQEIHKLLGVSYLFVENREEAEANFIELLTLEPGFSLDPLVFPIDVVDFFTEIKSRHAERLAALTKARADEEAVRLKAQEEKRKLEIEALRRNVYLGRNRQENSMLVALTPFGAGQFQNRHKVKGALYLSGELLLTATAITTFILHENLREQSTEPFVSQNKREEYERMETGYRITNRVSLVALGLVMIAGIVDSLFYFEREEITWEPLKEKNVPENLRPGGQSITLIPFIIDTGIGIGASGEF